MPIYAYKCESCGHSKDVLQKMSDAPLTDCPQCGAATFKKQLTAAGFQLKGSGWYVTDFRGGAPAGQGGEPGAAAVDSKPGDSKPVESKPTGAKTSDAAAPASTPAPTPAAPAKGTA